MAKKKIEQPNEDAQRELAEVMDDTPTEVTLRDKKVKIGWLRNGTIAKLRKITMGDHKDELMVSAKCTAAILLNGYWAIKFRWWFKWRWMYYVKQYSDEELSAVIEEGKKKLPALEYFKTTMSLIGLRDTMMAMTRKEVARIQAELHGAQPTQ